MDERLFDELLQVLRQEMGCYRQLLDLLHREKGLLVKGDLEGLTELLKRKETLGLEVKVLEEARLGLLQKVGAALGLEERDLTCSKLAQLAPPFYAFRYGALLGEFRELIGQVADLNKQNGVLLEGALQWTRNLLHLFTTVAWGPTYREDGALEGGRPGAPLFTFNQWV